MKKIFLLCSIILCYMSSYATITLTASPSLTASGTSVTVTAHGETSNSYIIGSMGAPTSIQTFPSQTYAANMGADLIAPVSYYNSTTGAPFTITMSVTNGNCTQVSVVYYFNINVLTNGVSAWTTMSVALQVSGGCTYWNVAESANFTRNNCGTGYTGSTVSSTIAAHTYSSTVSQTDANNKAIAALNGGAGQNYANQNGTCTLNCAAPVITSYTVDGGGSTNLAQGPHVVVVHFTGNALTSATFTKGSNGNGNQSINITSTSYDNTAKTATCNFYYTYQDSPPSALNIALTNACGTATQTINFYRQ